MKIYFLIVPVCAFMLAGCGSSTKDQQSRSVSLFSQQNEQIPIMAWYGVPPEESTVERYMELRHSGITHQLSFFSDVDELAVAMESRCYHGGEGRTRMKTLKTAGRDYVALLCGVLVIAAVIVLGQTDLWMI